MAPDASPDGVAHDWSARKLVTESQVRGVGSRATVVIGSRTLLTPLAVDAARELEVRFRRGPEVKVEDPDAASLGPPPPGSRIALGSDHGGFALKRELAPLVRDLGYSVQDLGCHGPGPVDYPDVAERVAIVVAAGAAARGVILDGAGIGSCMVANKVPGIRAALAYDLSSCRNAREHNDANVLTLGARLVGPGLAADIVTAFLATPFGGGRHAARVDKIRAVESRMAGS